MRETERHKAGEAGDSLAVHVQKLTILANTRDQRVKDLSTLISTKLSEMSYKYDWS